VILGGGDLLVSFIREVAVEAASAFTVLAGAPPTAELAVMVTLAGVVGLGEGSGTGGTVVDAGAVDDTVGDEDAIASGGLAGDIPADRGQREDTGAVATAGMDAPAAVVAVIAVTEIVQLGAVAAGGTVLGGDGGTAALVALAGGTVILAIVATLGVAGFDERTIPGCEIFDVGTVLAFLEVIKGTDAVVADKALAFRETARQRGIAGDGAGAAGTIGDGLGNGGVASASRALVLRAAVAVGDDGVGGSGTIGIRGSRCLDALATGGTGQLVTTLIDGGIRIVGDGASQADQGSIDLSDAGTQMVGRRSAPEATEVGGTGIFVGLIGLAFEGAVLGEIGDVLADTVRALGSDAKRCSRIGRGEAGNAVLEVGSVDAAAQAIALLRRTERTGGTFGSIRARGARRVGRVHPAAIAGGITSGGRAGTARDSRATPADASRSGAGTSATRGDSAAALREAGTIVGGVTGIASASNKVVSTSTGIAKSARAEGTSGNQAGAEGTHAAASVLDGERTAADTGLVGASPGVALLGVQVDAAAGQTVPAAHANTGSGTLALVAS